MARVPSTIADSRKLLVDRVAQSRYIGKSARLHDLLIYLTTQVIEHGAVEIHEQEVGRAVFGRPENYETALDNIVRVHASMLRKRLEQYFAGEGHDEPVVIELPKGNYAPSFRERVFVQPRVETVETEPPEAPPPATPHGANARLLLIAVVLLACVCGFLSWRLSVVSKARVGSVPPAVTAFWSTVFRPHQKTDIVLDDASLSMYEDLAKRPIALSDYFDRSYLRQLGQKEVNLLQKRQTSYSSANLLWQLSRVAGALESDATIHFARDYSFRELKANASILLGNAKSNPWIERFDNSVGLRWQLDPQSETYFPVDTWAAGSVKEDQYHPGGEHPDAYCSLALIPGAPDSGNTLLVAGTGGSAINSATAFLLDDASVARLRARLGAGSAFPPFEVLLRIANRSRLPKDVEIVIARRPRG